MMWNDIKAVFLRELDLWRLRPIYYLGPLGIMIFCAAFYLTFLGEGLPSDLPIAIVDNDNSSLSRNFTRQLDATQLGKVVHYEDYTSARADMQRGKITSICIIPSGFYSDVQANRQPKMTVYFNGLYFVGGALSYQDLLTMLNLTSGAVHREVLRAKGVDPRLIDGMIRPLDIDAHKIGNPLTSYNECLSPNMLPGTLQMVIILLLIYSLGTEMKYSTSTDLMNTAGGSICAAIAGKLLLFTIFYTLLGFLVETLLYTWMHFPLAGSILNMMLDMFLLVLASEAVAVFIIGLFPICRFALSVGALFCVLSLSLTGFTLPVEAMPRILNGFTYMFPLRHYYLFEVQEAFYGSGFAGWWQEALWLLAFLIPPFFLLPRLKSAYINQDYPKN